MADEMSAEINLNENSKEIAENNDKFYYITEEVCLSKVDLLNTQFLYLKNSKINHLPEDFFLQLPNIKWLDLRDNSIPNIPKSIENHKSLETLLLLNNCIEHLPIELCTVENLKHLQLAGNPIVFPKKSIVNSGIKTLKEYLRFFYNKNVDETVSKANLEHEPVDVYNDNDEKVDKRKRLLRFLENVQDTFKEVVNDFTHPFSNDIQQNNKTIKHNAKHFNSNRYVKRPRAWSKYEMTRRIKYKAKEETVIEKKKKDLIEIEAILQGRKTKEELKNWRHKYKKEKTENPKSDFSLELSQLPYGTDPEFAKIFTKSQIAMMQDALNKREEKKIRRPSKDNDSGKSSLELRMMDLEKCLNEIDIKHEGDSPRRYQRNIAEDMRKLIKLQKEISQLKMENENLP